MLSKEVQQRIDDCRKNKSKSLNLNGCGLVAIPAEISELIWLKELNLSNNQISKIEGLDSLLNLSELDLSDNRILKIEGLDSLWNLSKLNLDRNLISKLEGLDTLVNLSELNLPFNEISKIEGLDSLLNLSELDLSFHEISKIEGLDSLGNLSKLNLNNNQISKIEGLDLLVNLSELDLFDNQIIKIKGLDTLVNLSSLRLFSNQILKIEGLESLENLSTLSLNSNHISKIEGLDSLINLSELYFFNNQISKIEGLDSLVNLSKLSLFQNQILKIEGLDSLVNLSNLYLSMNKISKIEGLVSLVNLSELDISAQSFKNGGLDLFGNLTYQIPKFDGLDLPENPYQISKIEGLDSLVNLSQLCLSHNRISKIEGLDSLVNLSELDISSNQISKIECLDSLINLSYLEIDTNPLEKKYGIELEASDNHWPIIKNIMDREAEDNKIEILLPAKILLLGNHASGKSSLLHYLQNQNIDYPGDSTHILKIESFSINKDEEIDAIFYDFGGQDYYHGIYRAFLSAGSGYLLLWNAAKNGNNVEPGKDGTMTQNFALNYWLGQKAYLEIEKYRVEYSDPLLLIQTHAEEGGRPDFVDLSNCKDVVNWFYVSVNEEYNPPRNQNALLYLRSEIETLIIDRQKIREEPRWYEQFIKGIFAQQIENGKYEVTHVENIENYTPKAHEGNEQSRLDSLRAELGQLHNQGLVLFYPKIDKNLVWLNPRALVKHIHDSILNKEILSLSNGRVPIRTFAEYDQNIIKLLEKQKVLFRHEYAENNEPEYILPNFLPLVEADKTEYDLFTFGLVKPSFVLKFDHFLPVGLINQMICWFGKQPDNKKFWRNQLLFTLEQKAKVLIRLDFESLEIKVHISCLKAFEKEEKNIKAYLFYCILALYWDMELLEYQEFIKTDHIVEDLKSPKFENRNRIYEKEECRPQDLFVSLDDIYFVKYTTLCSHNEKEPRIIAYKKENAHEKEISVYPFQLFTNKQFTKMKKIFISYSKDDLAMVNKFIEHLSALQLDGKVAHWYCTELIAGGNWNDDIQSHFDQSDIVCFMVSPNLMKTKYIHEYEIKKAFERKKTDTDFKIVPIILDFGEWTTKEKNLGQFTALPYTAKPVASFKNQNEAWYITVACLRIMIEQNLNPIGDDFYTSQPLPKDILRIYERIVAGKVDDNS